MLSEAMTDAEIAAELGKSEAHLAEIKEKIEAPATLLHTCDELRLELSHYAHKLTKLGADPAVAKEGKKKSFFGVGSKDNKIAGNLEKKARIEKEVGCISCWGTFSSFFFSFFSPLFFVHVCVQLSISILSALSLF